METNPLLVLGIGAIVLGALYATFTGVSTKLIGFGRDEQAKVRLARIGGGVGIMAGVVLLAIWTVTR